MCLGVLETIDYCHAEERLSPSGPTLCRQKGLEIFNLNKKQNLSQMHTRVITIYAMRVK
jgi:hypothetical protein